MENQRYDLLNFKNKWIIIEKCYRMIYISKTHFKIPINSPSILNLHHEGVNSIMENKIVINDLSKFVTVAQKVREITAHIKSEQQISFEELFILNYIQNSEKDRSEFNVKEIIQLSHLKPYFISKAIQKLKERGLLSKKRNKNDERTVILVIDAAQRQEIESLCNAISKIF